MRVDIKRPLSEHGTEFGDKVDECRRRIFHLFPVPDESVPSTVARPGKPHNVAPKAATADSSLEVKVGPRDILKIIVETVDKHKNILVHGHIAQFS